MRCDTPAKASLQRISSSQSVIEQEQAYSQNSATGTTISRHKIIGFTDVNSEQIRVSGRYYRGALYTIIFGCDSVRAVSNWHFSGRCSRSENYVRFDHFLIQQDLSETTKTERYVIENERIQHSKITATKKDRRARVGHENNLLHTHCHWY
jgi:hypothetical protein